MNQKKNSHKMSQKGKSIDINCLKQSVGSAYFLSKRHINPNDKS